MAEDPAVLGIDAVDLCDKPGSCGGGAGSGELYAYDLASGENIHFSHFSHFGRLADIWSSRPRLFILHVP